MSKMYLIATVAIVAMLAANPEARAKADLRVGDGKNTSKSMTLSASSKNFELILTGEGGCVLTVKHGRSIDSARNVGEGGVRTSTLSIKSGHLYYPAKGEKAFFRLECADKTGTAESTVTVDHPAQ